MLAVTLCLQISELQLALAPVSAARIHPWRAQGPAHMINKEIMSLICHTHSAAMPPPAPPAVLSPAASPPKPQTNKQPKHANRRRAQKPTKSHFRYRGLPPVLTAGGSRAPRRIRLSAVVSHRIRQTRQQQAGNNNQGK